MNSEPQIRIGSDIPWNRIKQMMLRVRSFTPFAVVAGNKVIGLQGLPYGLPYGMATVEMVWGQSLDEAEEIVAFLPIVHREDFKVFKWLFRESDLSDEEEVIVSYQPAWLFGWFRPKFTVMVFPAGALEIMNRATSSSDMPSPIWSRDPAGGFIPPSSIYVGDRASRGKIGPTDTF